MKRKALLAMICVAVLAAAVFLLPTSADAATEGYYTYEVTDSGAIITNVDDTICGDITIPSDLGGYIVTEIGDYAFALCSNLNGVTIPSSINQIGYGAFSWCVGLSNITFQGDAPKFAEDAFEWVNARACYPAGNETWDEYIRQNYGGEIIWFVAADIPDGLVYEISFNKVTITDYSGSAKELSIPDAIEGCPVTYIGRSAFRDCESLYNVTIPNSVASIEDYAFRNCSKITEITIPDSVTSIGSSVFTDCSGLTKVTIGNSVSEIGSWAFNSCDSLISVSIGTSVTSIGDYAFSQCSSLKEIMIPDGVTSIDDTAFSSCTSLTGIWVGSENPNYSSDEFGVLYNKEKTELLIVPAGITGQYFIPESVTSIGNSAFYDVSKLQYNIYDNAKYLGNQYNPYFALIVSVDLSITSCEIHPDTRVIAGAAFDKCTKLTEITIPNGVSNIGDSTFSNCKGMINVIIPDSVISIGDSAFKNCSSVTDIAIPESVTHIGGAAFSGCSSLTGITIPNGVTYIGSYAFRGCNNLTDIVIPDGVSSIEPSTFEGCSGLNSITIPDGVSSIGSYAFWGCINLYIATISDSVVKIDYYAFKDCSNLSYVTVGNGIRDIDVTAFENCNSLKYNVYDNAKYLGNRQNPYYVLIGNSDLYITSCTVHPNTEVINNWAFNSCTKLDGVVIPTRITYIGEGAFNKCLSLTNVYYTGTEEQWGGITINDWNHSLLNAELIFNYIFSHICAEWGEWVVTKTPTFISSGERSKVCTVCGDTVTETMDMLVGKVQQWNIVLKDDLAANFYLQISESIENTSKVKLIVGNDTVTYNVSALEKTPNGNYLLSADIFAAQMNELIIVMVMNGRDIGSTATYSVRQYCDTILADEKHSQYHALVKEMLNYGAMAQRYFGYDPENPANTGITGTAAEEIPESTVQMSAGGRISGVTYYGASLLYRDKIAVRFYFTGDVAGCTVSDAKGNAYTLAEKDGMYYVEVGDILPQDLDESICLTVTDQAGNAITVTYSPMNYIVRMSQKGNENLKALLKALYNYHLAAKNLPEAA